MERDRIIELHEKILYPVVRVRTKKAGGSGTIIYSDLVPGSEDEYESYVLTCHHVVDDLISVDKNYWDEVLKAKRPKEVVSQAQVEVFEYKYISEVDSSKGYRADIIGYSSHAGGKDLAILKLDTPKQMPHVAKVFMGDSREILCLEEMFVSGCSLGHDPFASHGEITCVNEDIDNHRYFMANAPSVFGNSGGAAFRGQDLTLIGVTARVSVVSLGFSADIMTWMEFSVHPEELQEFFEEQHLQFLVDDKYTSTECFEKRKELQEKARMAELRHGEA